MKVPPVRPVLRRLCLALATSAGLMSPAARGGEPVNVADVAALVRAHNRMRAEQDLPPLVENPKLNAAALVHARDMAEHERMSHEGSDKSTPAQRIARQDYAYQAAGENVAEGQPNIKTVMRSWMDSPPHRKNILGDYTEMGAACVKDKEGTPYWCVNFGLPWPVLDPVKASAEVIEGFNRARAKAGKPRLMVSPTLQKVAGLAAHDMAEHATFSPEKAGSPSLFERIDRARYRFRSLGATSAEGQPSPAAVLKTWLEDRTNRENVLGDFTQVGVGYATTAKGKPYWCAIFAKPAR